MKETMSKRNRTTEIRDAKNRLSRGIPNGTRGLIVASILLATSFASAGAKPLALNCPGVFSAKAAAPSNSQAGTATDPRRADPRSADPRVPTPRKLRPEVDVYEAARGLTLPVKGTDAKRIHGDHVTARDHEGHATHVRLNLLIDNLADVGAIRVVGPFNNWGETVRTSDILKPMTNHPEIFTVEAEGLKHGMPYRFLVKGRQLIDPAANMYTTAESNKSLKTDDKYLNSVFWDLRDPSLYQTKTDFVDISERPNLIGEVELYSLVEKFRSSQTGETGPQAITDTYKFIAESGVIAKLKEAGFSAIEMLPFNQSIDGAHWHFRYQIFGNFAPDSKFGTPSEFKQMIDAFHEHGLAVVMDVVVGHYPDHANLGERSLGNVGLNQWKKRDGTSLFGSSPSPWGTVRYDYENPFVRRFLVDGITHMMSEYKIDGLRLDNVDGITGQPKGETFLKELVNGARKVNPRALIVGESFSPPENLMERTDRGGLGLTSRNDGYLFEYWHHNLLGPTEQLNMFDIAKRIGSPYDWKGATMMRYLSNHDEAANGRDGFTGQYPASLIGGDSYYAFSKVKAADALNMLVGTYHLTFLQSRLMQTGTFDKNPSIDWSLAESGRGQQLWKMFGSLSRFMQKRASYFNFASLRKDVGNHVDDTNKVISLKRVDPATGRELYILINLGHHDLKNYTFGVDAPGEYRAVFDSEIPEFGGAGELARGAHVYGDSRGLHGKPARLNVPVVAPYSVTIFEAAQP